MGGYTQRPWTPTKRRGPIAAEYNSPGPACVSLPTYIGTKISIKLHLLWTIFLKIKQILMIQFLRNISTSRINATFRIFSSTETFIQQHIYGPHLTLYIRNHYLNEFIFMIYRKENFRGKEWASSCF